MPLKPFSKTAKRTAAPSPLKEINGFRICLIDDVGTHKRINGLSDKYGSLAQIIAHKILSFLGNCCDRCGNGGAEQFVLVDRTPYYGTNFKLLPQVLLAEASSRNQTGWNNRERDNRTTTREVCRNFGTGILSLGRCDACFVSFKSPLESSDLNVAQQTAALPTLLQAQQTMLAQFGFNGLSGQSRPTAPPGFQSGQQTTQQAFSLQYQALLSGTVQGSTPANGQVTLLPQAFNTMTLPGSNRANWNNVYWCVVSS
ncbi:hypothetical protein Tco_1409938 [Tanacetum coccineum]